MPVYPVIASRGSSAVGGDNSTDTYYVAHGFLGSGTSTITTEAIAELTARLAITWQNLSLNVASVGGSASVTFSARKNGSTETALQVTFTSAGVIEDLVGSVSLVDGDDYNYFADETNGMHGDNYRLDTVYSEFDTGGTNQSPIAVSNPGLAIAGAAPESIAGQFIVTQAEARSQYTARQPYTWANLRAYLTAFSSGGTQEILARVNGVDDTTLRVTPSATGVVEDLTGSISVVAGDEINWQADEGAGAFELGSISSTLGDTASPLIHKGSWSNAGTEYAPIAGGSTTGLATEQDAECTFHTTPTLQNAFAYVSSAATTGTITLRKNRSSETALQLSLTATGIVEDLVGSVSVVADDEINWIGVVSSGTGVTQLVAVEAETGAAAPAASLIYDPHRPRRVMLTR